MGMGYSHNSDGETVLLLPQKYIDLLASKVVGSIIPYKYTTFRNAMIKGYKSYRCMTFSTLSGGINSLILNCSPDIESALQSSDDAIYQ